MSAEREELLASALELARRAGALVASYFGQPVDVDHKPGHEPVTRADRESQQLILNELQRRFPGDGFLAEECEDQTSWRAHRRVWVIDPLDGTKDFIAGRSGFSVMIGVLQDFQPVLGVVHQPMNGLTFQAALGEGATLLDTAARTELHTREVRELSALRLVASKSHRSSFIDEVKRTLGITDEQNVGSVGVKMGLIARGDRDLYINRHPCKLWDVCAPQIILTEAGGQVSDVHGDPIRYDSPAIQLQRGLVASGGSFHQAVISALAAIVGPRP